MQHWSEVNTSPNSERPAAVNPADAIAEIEREIKNLADEKKRRGLNKIETFFPDTGPFRRELYGKHLEFFKAGKYYRSRLFSAGNRCLTPWSPVETDRATRRCVELLGAAGFGVQSWDGSSRCTKKASPVFLRGIEQAFLLRLDNGQEVQCSGRHRVLTASGWLSLDQLIRLSGGLRCRHRQTDSQGSCAVGDRRHDGLHPRAGGSGQHRPRPIEHAQQDDRLFSPVDAEERTREYIRASQQNVRHPSHDAQILLSDLCAQFEDPSSCIDALWSLNELRDVQKFAFELGHQQPVPQYQLAPYVATRPSQIGPHAGEDSESWASTKGQWLPLSDRLEVLLTSGAEFLASTDRNETFLPIIAPNLGVVGTSILSIHRLGYQPIVDFTVEDTHNYSSQGLVHSNCGKTIAGAYEMALHLSGNYPNWWEGRRFDEAINAWACGTTNETTKNILQAELLGKLEKDESVSSDLIGMGTGMIPAHLIAGVEFHAQIRGAIKTAWVRHVSGTRSQLQFKSFESGREAFEGTSIHVVALDETPSLEIYTECLMRTFTTSGICYITATPLNGLTDLVQQFMPDGVIPETQIPV